MYIVYITLAATIANQRAEQCRQAAGISHTNRIYLPTRFRIAPDDHWLSFAARDRAREYLGMANQPSAFPEVVSARKEEVLPVFGIRRIQIFVGAVLIGKLKIL